MIDFEIERLLDFAVNKKMIEDIDVICFRNFLMDFFGVKEPYSGEKINEKLETVTPIMDKMLDYCVEKGMMEDTITNRDLMAARIMGILMPRESEVVQKFNMDCVHISPQKATDNFYGLSKASNYIQVDRISKNLYWTTPTEFGDIEITVNLSKPEKDPKDIAASKNMPQTNYPKCLLCLENVGFAGNVNHPARQNHRVIPFTLNDKQYYFQYSPYVYYNEHCIVFNEQHTPMKINKDTFVSLFDFVDRLPHYFIGSNADLPIVGGSILSHDHFQGGRHIFAMEKAEEEKVYINAKYSDIKISRVKWPLSVIRISGEDRKQLIEFADEMLKAWRNYSDEKADIYAYTENTPHNTITPIARKNKNGEYEMDLVLRNNRTSQEYPLGIFHPHQELHHIKKENIGLIEVMGLAVLPGRLSTEMEGIIDILTGEKAFDKEELLNEENPLNKHLPWIEEMLLKYKNKNTKEKAEQLVKQEIGEIFKKVLMDAGVYKTDENGREAFDRFMESIDCR